MAMVDSTRVDNTSGYSRFNYSIVNGKGLRASKGDHYSRLWPACDLAISGLGWIAVEPMGRSLRTSGSDIEEIAKQLKLSIRVLIPVGKGGGEWYQYRELTEKEVEVRPKWYF
ncbi:hypothetical protein PVL29_020987 [Vitis rotundifolia]|uniref:Uncharacterized protein n=1 Tax=Vitis rotundifolia TaxID=103349 RepID=A0AA38YYP6_VITRO|nr:hypothetical protein PVL29_020987 [Vitis rotundifolia]